MKERREPPGLAGASGGEVGDRLLGEEHRQEVAGPGDLMRYPRGVQRPGQQAGQAVGGGVQCGVQTASPA